MTDNKSFDVAVIGGGPNGLICGTYLAKCGLKVVILEARHETGGGLDTFEYAGFRYNPHAIYHMMGEYMPPYSDLNLKENGVKYIYPDVQCSYISKNHKPLIFYRDPEKTAQYISVNFSKTDGDAYRKMYADFSEFSEKILMPLTYVPPVPFIEQAMILNNAADDAGKRYNEIAELTPINILSTYRFSDPVKAGILNLFTMWGMPAFELGFLFPLYVYKMTNASIVAGGSHRLSSAIYRSFLQAGGTVMDRAEVVKVITEGGRPVGVLTRDGVVVRAKIIASTCDPHQNFLEFFDKSELPAQVVDSAKKWQWEKETFFGAHFALRKAPVYDENMDANNALITFLGIDNTDELIHHIEDVQSGIVPDVPMGHVTCASIFDPIQAYGDFHTGRWESLAPFDADWEKITPDYTKLCVNEWKKYAPNFDPINIIPYPPTYIEMKNKSMKKGSFKHGAYVPLQMGYLRPNDLCSQGFTPIEGFYVCGASTYPGGMILGAGGYLGANLIADDLGVKKTWKEPEFLTVAKERGFIVDR
jgi:phytoene dehydrogenase-like protein